MRVSARIKRVDTKGATGKAVLAHKKAVTATTEAARVDTDPFVPYVTHALRDTAWLESKPASGLLIYGNSAVPYASAQYYGLPGKTWPGTQMHWFEVAKKRFSGKWRQITAAEYNRHFGG